MPALVAGGAFVLFLPTYFHLTSGLETVAFAAIVLRIVIVALRIVDGQAVHVWEPPLLLVLAGMLRPDGVLAALPALAVWLWLSRRDRRAWLWTAGAAAVGLGYERPADVGEVVRVRHVAPFGVESVEGGTQYCRPGLPLRERDVRVEWVALDLLSRPECIPSVPDLFQLPEIL